MDDDEYQRCCLLPDFSSTLLDTHRKVCVVRLLDQPASQLIKAFYTFRTKSL